VLVCSPAYGCTFRVAATDYILLGVDTGGTFTDFVVQDGGPPRTHKVLSTPDDPARAIVQGIAALGLTAAAAAGRLRLVHGSTVATNAALEGKGARTVYVTNHGFTDVLRIGRQARAQLYDLHPAPAFDPVPEDLLLGTGGRLDPAGNVIEPLTDADLLLLRERVRALAPEAIAINLLYSYVDDRFECAIEAALEDLAFVSRSSFVLPEYREYERGIATWLNARLGPVVHRYLGTLGKAVAPSTVAVMQSSGGLIDARQASRRAVNLLLSGPAGGLAAAAHLGRALGTNALLTFDMGGTSTDVALLEDGPRLTDEGRIGTLPVAIPMAEIHTIGAGGGSIAWLDMGGALQVGPQSAGADPGPACYGQGGQAPTVTDAHVVLGTLPAGARLGGSLRLDAPSARAALAGLAAAMSSGSERSLSVEDLAHGVIRIANEHMAQALRVISLERGYDPRAFTLVCFGGAGGLHVCALADTLGVDRIVVPAYGGVFSALGMLVATPSRHLVQTVGLTLAGLAVDDIESRFRTLERTAMAELVAEGHAERAIRSRRSVDLRYHGQSFYLNLPWEGPAETEARFHQRHEARYGHAFSLPVEIVNVRTELEVMQTPPTLPPIARQGEGEPARSTNIHGIGLADLFERERLGVSQCVTGPALIVEAFATTLVAPGWTATTDAQGHLMMRRVG
jgi:N-methylhydantoinase A